MEPMGTAKSPAPPAVKHFRRGGSGPTSSGEEDLDSHDGTAPLAKQLWECGFRV